ncbi:3-deoxy-D-manno-octulosonic acid transferase [Opitutaceae bacterium]
MLWLYRLFFLPVLLVSAPYYLWRMRRRGGYGEDFSQRLGAVPALSPKRPGVRRIWLQAVSVGEMLAIEPVLAGLAADPTVEIYLTTTTSTGHRLAVERYQSRVAGIGYFPTDAWLFSARAWRRVDPDLVILAEGERWPEHIAQARARGVPVVCINARLSDRSYRRMKAWAPVMQPLLAGITRLLPASELDALRFRDIGFPADRITTTGNIKLDVTITPLTNAEIQRLRDELGLGQGGLIVLGSSTWPGEEAALLGVLRDLHAAGLPCRLLLVPRHAERRGELETLLADSGWTHHFRSYGQAPSEVDVAVGDTTGELRKMTQLADVVFVGKSLAPHHEGQTPVEAAALGRPILFGPEMSNFRLIASELVEAGAAQRVATPAELGFALKQLLMDPAQRKKRGAAGVDWHRRNRGAVERTLQVIRDELGKR